VQEIISYWCNILA